MKKESLRTNWGLKMGYAGFLGILGILICLPAVGAGAKELAHEDELAHVKGGVSVETTQPVSGSRSDYDNVYFNLRVNSTANPATRLGIYAGDAKTGGYDLNWSGSNAQYSSAIETRVRWPIEWNGTVNTQVRYFVCTANTNGGCDGAWLDSSVRPSIRLNEDKIKGTHKIIFWILGPRYVGNMNTDFVVDDTTLNYSRYSSYTPDGLFSQCWDQASLPLSQRQYPQFRQHRRYTVSLGSNISSCGEQVVLTQDGNNNDIGRMSCSRDTANNILKFDELIYTMKLLFDQDPANVGTNWKDFIHVAIVGEIRQQFTTNPTVFELWGLALTRDYYWHTIQQGSTALFGGNVILLEDGMTFLEFQRTLAHELAHQYGAYTHVASPCTGSTVTNDLMCENANGVVMSAFDCNSFFQPSGNYYRNYFSH